MKDIHESVALFYGRLRTSVMHEHGILRWWCLFGGERDGTKGDNTMQVSLDEQHISAEYMLQMVSTWCWLIPLIYAAGMLTLKNSCMEQTKELFFERERDVETSGLVGKWRVLWQLLKSEILKNKLQ